MSRKKWPDMEVIGIGGEHRMGVEVEVAGKRGAASVQGGQSFQTGVGDFCVGMWHKQGSGVRA